MIELTYIIPFLVFVAILGLFLGLAWYVGRQKGVRELLHRVDSTAESTVVSESRTVAENIRKLFYKATDRLGNLAKPTEEKEITHLKKLFLQAGWADRTRNTMMIFLGSKVLLAIAIPVLLLILKVVVLPVNPARFIIFLAMSALLGFYLPDIWLKMKVAERKTRILRGFPDALDLMVICTDAGMGLDMAIARVGEETKLTNPSLSEELRRLNLELRAGKSRHDALKGLAMRTGVEDIESFVTLVVQTDRFGTSVSRALRVQAESMRIRRSQLAEELAAKLPVKLIFPTILFIFPSLFLILAGPAMIQAFRAWTRS